MKGLILVGGLGTQLRPLTLSTPKPLIEFGNKPQLVHFIDALVEAGVTEVVLAITYRPEIMHEFLEKCQKQYGIKITNCVELQTRMFEIVFEYMIDAKVPVSQRGHIQVRKRLMATSWVSSRIPSLPMIP